MSEHYLFPFGTSPLSQDSAFWRGGAFSDNKLLKKALNIFDAMPKHQATVSGNLEGEELDEMRASLVSWVHPNTENKWIYENLEFVINDLNHNYFKYDLTGVQSAQYTVYDTTMGKGGHYDWHVDMLTGPGVGPCRKLSLVWQLSDPSEYEGGELQIWGTGGRVFVPREKGLVYAFPSTTLHRVTPVTRGVRKSLVVWAVGPQFR